MNNECKSHIIAAGDSIQKIAMAYNISDWMEIVYFNNLKYPFVIGDVNAIDYTPGAAKIGDVIFIPSDSSVSVNSQQEVNLELISEQAYGCDLDVYTSVSDNGKAHNFEDKGEVTSDNGDLMLAKGLDNLKQQITIKLSTVKGTLMLHPTWGCDLLARVGSKGTEDNLIDMMLSVKEALLEDFRIIDVKNLSVTKSGVSAVVDCDIVPVPPYAEFHYNETISEH